MFRPSVGKIVWRLNQMAEDLVSISITKDVESHDLYEAATLAEDESNRASRIAFKLKELIS